MCSAANLNIFAVEQRACGGFILYIRRTGLQSKRQKRPIVISSRGLDKAVLIVSQPFRLKAYKSSSGKDDRERDKDHKEAQK